MIDPVEELKSIAGALTTAAENFDKSSEASDLEKLREVAETVGRAWSQSWIGYQANVYFTGLKQPPPGTHFSKEWGLYGPLAASGPGWVECDPDEVRSKVHDRAGKPDLDKAGAAARAVDKVFSVQKEQLVTLLHSLAQSQKAPFLQKLVVEAEAVEPITAEMFIAHQAPKQAITRDDMAGSQGLRIPPHITVMAQVAEFEGSAIACDQLATVARKSFSFLERSHEVQRRERRIGTNAFIGHGHSKEWMVLKDFISERLNLPWDEFNRVPVAGTTNIARLSEMLDAAAIAFVVMTAEDEQKDGKVRARENVVHEAGLFQGRLGFTKAIVLLEEGCEEFSNINGLGQIRFPSQKISSCFEEIRRVLEREGVIVDIAADGLDPSAAPKPLSKGSRHK